MKPTAIYLLIDISKTPDGSIQPDIRKAIQLFYSHLDGFSFKEHISLNVIGIERSSSPIVRPLNSPTELLEVLDWNTNSSAGLDLASGLRRFIQDVEDRSHQSVKTIMFLNERSGTPIYKYVKKLESMSYIIEPFFIVACNETAKLHQKNIPDASWIDMKDYLNGSHEILLNWLSNIDAKEGPDVIVNVGFNPISSLQEIIQKNKFSEIQLFPNEFKGPLTISKPLTIDGRGATIWVPKGPGVHITSSGVQLKNLRIEVTDKSVSADSMEEDCAIKINPDISANFENILVRGTVSGLLKEEGDWDYPHTLDLGMLPGRVPTTGLLRMIVPTYVKIISQVEGLEIDQELLIPGFNEMRINIEEMPPNTLIDGKIALYSENFKRLIHVRGYVISEKSMKVKKITKVFWQPENSGANISNQQKTFSEKFFYWFSSFSRRKK